MLLRPENNSDLLNLMVNFFNPSSHTNLDHHLFIEGGREINVDLVSMKMHLNVLVLDCLSAFEIDQAYTKKLGQWT